MAQLIDALAAAIARQENVNPKFNNPGAIMDVEYYKQTKQFRLQQYGSMEEGWQALKQLVGKYVDRGETLTSFFTKYAPSGHGANNPSNYASNVATWLGIPTNVELRQLLPSFNLPANFHPGQQLTPNLQAVITKTLNKYKVIQES